MRFRRRKGEIEEALDREDEHQREKTNTNTKQHQHKTETGSARKVLNPVRCRLTDNLSLVSRTQQKDGEEGKTRKDSL